MPGIARVRRWLGPRRIMMILASSRIVLGVVLLAASGGIYASVASAVEAPATPSPISQAPPRGITISPSFKDSTISSGLIEATSNITVTNNIGSDLVGSIRVVDFQSLGDFGGISLGQAGLPPGKYGLANWITLPGGNNVLLPKGQATTIKVNIQNRADLAPGGHYGAIIVTTSSPSAANNNTIKFKQELTSLLFVKKLGGEQFGLQLQSLAADKIKDVPGTVSLKFSSTGNVYVVPRGYIDVTDSKGRLLAKGVINPESTLVLPETSRIFTTVLHAVSGGSLPRSYTVTAYYRYDGQNNFTSKSIQVSARRSLLVPILGLTVTGVVLFIGTYRYRTRNKFMRRPKRR